MYPGVYTSADSLRNDRDDVLPLHSAVAVSELTEYTTFSSCKTQTKEYSHHT